MSCATLEITGRTWEVQQRLAWNELSFTDCCVANRGLFPLPAADRDQAVSHPASGRSKRNDLSQTGRQGVRLFAMHGEATQNAFETGGMIPIWPTPTR